MRAISEEGSAKKMSHAKLSHMETNSGVALSLVFIQNMGGCDCLQVGIVSRKCPEHAYGFAIVKNGEIEVD